MINGLWKQAFMESIGYSSAKKYLGHLHGRYHIPFAPTRRWRRKSLDDSF